MHANDNPVKYDDLSKYSLLFPNEQLETEIEASRSLIQSDKEQHHIPHGKEYVQENVCLYPFDFFFGMNVKFINHKNLFYNQCIVCVVKK